MDGTPGSRESVDAENRKVWELMMRKPAAAAALSRRALADAESLGYAQGEAAALLNLSWCLIYLSRLDEALEVAGRALKAYRVLGERLGESMALNALGGASKGLGRFDLALEWFSKSLELADTIQSPHRRAAALNNIGEICIATGNAREALAKFMAAAEATKELEDKELEANILGNLGLALLDMGDQDEAVEYLELALDAAAVVGASGMEARVLRGLGVAYAKNGNRLVAHTFLEQSLKRAEETDQPMERVETLLELARQRHGEGDLAEAARVCGEALSGAEEVGAKRLVADAHLLRSKIREEQGDVAGAFSDYKLHHTAEVELSADEVTQRVRGVEARYEIERSRQEAEIFRLKNVELKEKSDELERTAKQVMALAAIGMKITASLDAEKIALTVYDHLSSLMDASIFGLAGFSEERNVLDFRLTMDAGKRLPPFSVQADSEESFAAWVVHNKRPLRLDDIQAEYSQYIASRRHRFGREANSLIYLPLMVEQRVVGVVSVQSPHLSAYTEEDVRLLSSLGSFIAVALENSRIHDELRKLNVALLGEKSELERLTRRVSYLANHDNLTGLPNRRLLKELLSQAISRADRAKCSVAVLYLDLDDFKPINDRFGHAAGDLTLMIIAERIRSALRASDTVARVGGDEFVVVLPDLDDPADAEKVAAKLVDSIGRPIDVQGSSCVVGVSVGVAVYPRDATGADWLMENADKAMYSAKRRGKRGVALFCDVQDDEEPETADDEAQDRP